MSSWKHKPGIYYAVYCPHCDHEIRTHKKLDYKFCPYCGNEIEGENYE